MIRNITYITLSCFTNDRRSTEATCQERFKYLNETAILFNYFSKNDAVLRNGQTNSELDDGTIIQLALNYMELQKCLSESPAKDVDGQLDPRGLCFIVEIDPLCH